jgi:hypothetical protein
MKRLESIAFNTTRFCQIGHLKSSALIVPNPSISTLSLSKRLLAPYGIDPLEFGFDLVVAMPNPSP